MDFSLSKRSNGGSAPLASSYGLVAYAQEADPADIVNDTAEVSSLLGKINDGSEGVSKVTLTQDSGLDKVAYDYTSELINAVADFRKTTDFKIIPNGKTVRSLVADNGITRISNSIIASGYVVIINEQVQNI